MEFSHNPATVMHVDINSCFATVEQQANPLYRGKPLAVAAYVEPHGCILAASTEAKKLGIKTGMRVGDAQNIYRPLIVLPPDPEKYRFVNRQLRTLLGSYSPDVSVESIDEMVMKLQQETYDMRHVAQEIKLRIKKEIGEWITVSIGIAPNRYLAKVASGLNKPDGLDVIDKESIETIFSRLQLEDLCGIKEGNATRLRVAGITTPVDMLAVSPKTLQLAFRSIVGYHWWMRLHGYQEEVRNDVQKSFGQSHALGSPRSPDDPRLWQILSQLVMKMARRLRKDEFTASGVGVSLQFVNHVHWRLQQTTQAKIFTDADFYQRAKMLLLKAPIQPVRILAVTCFDLTADLYAQQSLFAEGHRNVAITRAIDAIQERFGPFVVRTGRMLSMNENVRDRIAFGKV